MSVHCQQVREAFFGLGETDRAHTGLDGLGEPVARHLRECPACSSLPRRLEAQRDLLEKLDLRSAPAELEGRVVAVFETGHRQDRAVEALQALTPPEVPGELTARLEAGAVAERPALARWIADGPRAPLVLERLVAEEVDDPARTRTRRAMELLDRRAAPGALDRRIARLLRPLARWQRMPRPLVGAAAALLVLLVLPVLRRDRGEPASPTHAYSFRVVRGGSIRDLDPQARRLLEGVTGGALLLNRGNGEPR